MIQDFNELFTVEEACKALRVGYNTMYTLLKTGKLKGFRCGRVWKIPKGAIDRFVSESIDSEQTI